MAPRTVVTASLILVLAGGCGGGSSTADPEAQRVEDLVSRDAAEGLLSEGTPTAADIERAADQIDVQCEHTDGPDYECVFDWGEELGPRACTVRADDAATRVESIRCGGAEAPVTAGEYVDCATVSRVAEVSDLRHDLHENQRPVSLSVAHRPELEKADIVAMRVAATPDRLCVEWRTAAPIEPKYAFNVWIWPTQAPPHTIALAVTFEPGQDPDIGMSGGGGSLSGRAGTRGRWTSLLVEADQLTEEGRATLERPFTFSAQSAWVVGRTHPDQAYGDWLPNGSERPVYP
jgi:hypothetical protein